MELVLGILILIVSVCSLVLKLAEKETWGRVRYSFVWVRHMVGIYVPVIGIRARLNRLVRRGVMDGKVLTLEKMKHVEAGNVYQTAVIGQHPITRTPYRILVGIRGSYMSTKFYIEGVDIQQGTAVHLPLTCCSSTGGQHSHKAGGNLNCFRRGIRLFLRSEESVLELPNSRKVVIYRIVRNEIFRW